MVRSLIAIFNSAEKRLVIEHLKLGTKPFGAHETYKRKSLSNYLPSSSVNDLILSSLDMDREIELWHGLLYKISILAGNVIPQ